MDDLEPYSVFGILSLMPLYYFHGPGEGDGGEDLPDDAAAQRMAFDMFGQIIRENTSEIFLRMEVVDDTGRSVVRLSFSASASV